MFRKKLRESLTARIFFITALILFGAAAITFGLIAWATPITYTAAVNNDLTQQADALAEKLSKTSLADCGPLLDKFIRSSGAEVILTDSDGQLVHTGSKLSDPSLYEDETSPASSGARETSSVTWSASTLEDKDAAVTVTMSGQDTIAAAVKFASEEDEYFLYVTPRIQAENLAIQALTEMAPLLFLVLLIFSVLCALIYSRYITRPIVRLSDIAEKMAELDFNWECRESRQDELGKLGQSLNQMARRLSHALTKLEAANQALLGEVERERKLDKERMAFFSAASHELKTPVTILKGQLSGMLEGIDVYRDRDKYLLRSLQVTGRMEKLIQEMLSISKMESGKEVLKQEALDLPSLLHKQLALHQELLSLHGQHLETHFSSNVTVTGDPSFLGKAVGNLLSNAILYSPEGSRIRVWCGKGLHGPAFSIENTGVHIQEEALPHLFEAFYREEGSRNRSTGGSGLGLYLVRIILKRHQASCTIENTNEGVRATVCFPG